MATPSIRPRVASPTRPILRCDSASAAASTRVRASHAATPDGQAIRPPPGDAMPNGRNIAPIRLNQTSRRKRVGGLDQRQIHAG